MVSESQVAATMRHVYTAGGTLLTVATLIAVVPKDQVQPIMDALHQVGEGLQDVVGGISKLIVIIGPIIIGLIGKTAFSRSSFGQRLISVIADASGPENKDKKEQVVVATASIPEVQKIVAPDLAEAPSPKVVAQ